MFWIGLALGFGVGWLVFKRPEVMSRALGWLKGKVGL